MAYYGNPKSLQDQCMAYVISHVEKLSPTQLSALPSRFVDRLAAELPLLDLLRLENTAFANALDFKQFWGSVCADKLPRNSTEAFDLDCRQWLEELGVGMGSREFFLAFISNCALTSHYMPIDNVIHLLLVRRSSPAEIKSLLELCEDDEFIADYIGTVDSEDMLLAQIGKDMGISLPVRYLPYIFQWEVPSLLAKVLLEVVQYRPHVVWVPTGVRDEHLYTVLTWPGIQDFLNRVKAFHMSLSTPRVVGDALPGSWAPGLAENIFTSSPVLHTLNIVGTQAGLDRFFSHFKVPKQARELKLKTVEIISEGGDEVAEKGSKAVALTNLATLLNVSTSALTTLHLSYKSGIPSIESCRQLGKALNVAASQPEIREMSFHQLSILPKYLFKLLHSFLETDGTAFERKMLISECYAIKAHLSLTPKSLPPCKDCPSLKKLTIISTKLSALILSLLAQYSHIHLKELHLDGVQSDSPATFTPILSSRNFHCEKIVWESCENIYAPTDLRSLLSNSSIKHLEIAEVKHPNFYEDLSQGLQNQRSIGTLEELSVISCKMNQPWDTSESEEQSKEFFAALFALPQLDRFTLKLQYSGLQESGLQDMVNAWESTSEPRKRLKSLTIVDTCCTASMEPAVAKVTQHLSYRRARS